MYLLPISMHACMENAPGQKPRPRILVCMHEVVCLALLLRKTVRESSEIVYANGEMQESWTCLRSLQAQQFTPVACVVSCCGG
jgi:hypothetical protein